MIFKPELARAVVRGKKTQTRRRVKPGEPGCRYRVGKDYAVCPGRGKEAVGRLLVTGVRMEFLADLTLQDAIREGFRTRADFADYWMRMYSPAYVKAWPDGPDPQVLEAWVQRFGDAAVWVISFTRDTSEHPRLLRARMGSVSDYTENPHDAVRDAGEAVSEADQARLTAAAADRDERLQADAIVKARREIEQQLLVLEEALHPNDYTARRLEVLRRELRLLDRDLKAA